MSETESILIVLDEIDVLRLEEEMNKKKQRNENKIQQNTPLSFGDIVDYLKEEKFEKIIFAIDVCEFSNDEKDIELIYNEIKSIIERDMEKQKRHYKILFENKTYKEAQEADVYFLVNYTGRREISEIMKNIKSTEDPRNIELEEKVILENLIVPILPKFVIVCGRQTLPNVMIWQTTYSELYFTKMPFISLSREDFKCALNDYRKREKRYGH